MLTLRSLARSMCPQINASVAARPPAGFKGQPVCFLFTDAEVKDEAFLEYINQILMTGEVAGEGGGARGT